LDYIARSCLKNSKQQNENKIQILKSNKMSLDQIIALDSFLVDLCWKGMMSSLRERLAHFVMVGWRP
jgi:hypothetical protein